MLKNYSLIFVLLLFFVDLPRSQLAWAATPHSGSAAPSTAADLNTPAAAAALPLVTAAGAAGSGDGASAVVLTQEVLPPVKELEDSYIRSLKRPAPPFFRIVMSNGREIYILGSMHTIPLKVLLSEPAIKQIQAIASTPSSLLYLEHSGDSSALLARLGSERVASDLFTRIKQHQQVQLDNRALYIPDPQAQQRLESKLSALQKDFLAISQNNIIAGWDSQRRIRTVSNIPLSAVMNAPTWLATLILNSHANRLSYSLWGSPEDSIEVFFTQATTEADSKATYSRIRYLETIQETVVIAERNQGTEAIDNMNWLISSLYNIINLPPSLDKRQIQQALGDFTAKLNMLKPVSASIIARNRAWVHKLLQDLFKVDLSASDRKTRETPNVLAVASTATAAAGSVVSKNEQRAAAAAAGSASGHGKPIEPVAALSPQALAVATAPAAGSASGHGKPIEPAAALSPQALAAATAPAAGSASGNGKPVESAAALSPQALAAATAPAAGSASGYGKPIESAEAFTPHSAAMAAASSGDVMPPILIVVGLGHLEGSIDKNFLGLLLRELRALNTNSMLYSWDDLEGWQENYRYD